MALPCILIINLDQDTQRWESIRTRLQGVGISEHELIRIPAIYGKTLSPTERTQQTTMFCNKFCTPTMIGCFLSHRKCWQYIVDHHLPCAIVLEDDARPLPDFPSMVRRALSEVPRDYHILLLGCFLCQMFPSTDIMSGLYSQLGGTHNPTWISKNVRRPGGWAGTHAMIVSHAGARWCLNRWKRAEYHIDIVLRQERLLNIYATVRPLVNQRGWISDVDGEISHNTGKGDWIVQALNDIHLDDGQMSLGFAMGMPVLQVGTKSILVWHTILVVLTLFVVCVLCNMTQR
jgi:GR25 family glycosyltransferase involved in LPS biosynthesis